MTTLRQAAEAVVDSWDATYIAALRTALEAPEPELEIKVLQAKCDAFFANTQLALEELEAMTAERDEYQRAADSMAMSHKVERDGLMVANRDLLNWFDALKTDHDALLVAGSLALDALVFKTTGPMSNQRLAKLLVTINTLKQTGVK